MAKDVSFSGLTAGVLSPAMTKNIGAQGAYLDIQNNGWAKQYLPELYESEVQRYGNRTISGFLSQISAEMPMSSDQVIWSEQGRLHISYQATVATGTGALSAIKDIDNVSGSDIAHSLRVGNTVVCEVQGKEFKGFVQSVGANPVIIPYSVATVGDIAGVTDDSNQTIKLFVYGSEFKKGTAGMAEAVEPGFKTFTNKPMIIKDIADEIEMDVSTVSRVANSKYVDTPYGTKLIKDFFSESMTNDQGEEVSTREIKSILETVISEEDKKKPMTDEKLTVILKEKGYPIARRTVAKYREQLDLPVARLRKEL